MSPARRTEKICAGCSRDMLKAAILLEGKRYCKACWKKYFRPVPCQECRKMTSSYLGATPVTCKSCRSKSRFCVECGKHMVAQATGKVLPDGSALCPACVGKTREPGKCSNCGHVTKHLVRDAKAGFDEPVCSTCRHSVRPLIDCGICGKNKYLSGEIDGKLVCYSCFQEHQPTLCPSCGKVPLRAARSVCSDCEWRATVRQRAGELAGSLNQPWCRKLFLTFVEEHLETYGGYDTNLRFESYLPFFAALDSAFLSAENLMVDDVVHLFRVGDFKRYASPYSFLVKRGLVVESGVDDRSDALELASQSKMLQAVSGAWYGSLMVEFQAELVKINGRYKEHGWVGRRRRFAHTSITKFIRTAIKFCASARDVTVSTQFGNHHIQEYLVQTPGNREMLSPFVRFLRLNRKTFVRLKIPKKAQSFLNLDNIMATERCNGYLRQWLNPPDDNVKEALICLLMLLYAQRPSRIVLMQTDHIFEEKDGVYSIVVGKKKTLKLHEAVVIVLKRYLEQREATAKDDGGNKYLFPGRVRGSHLNQVSIKDYLRIYSVTSRELYATAMYRAVSMGVRLPSTLINGFGVSIKTAIAYLGFVDEQMYKDTKNLFR